MAYNGSGTFNRPVSPYVYDTVISETDVNAEMDGIATGLSNVICKDGQTTPTGNLPMGTYRHTGVGNASARTDYAAAGQVQDGAFTWCSVGGTADAITLTPTPAITAYATGQEFRFVATATNTGAATIAVSGLTAKAAQNDGGALVAGDITSGKLYSVTYDGTRFQIQKISTSRVVTIRDHGAAGDGSTDDTVALQSFLTAIANAGADGYVPPGVYLLNSAHITFTGLSGITVRCADGAIFRDAGRLVVGADASSKRIPWGVEFVNCSTIEWSGGQWETSGSDLTGASDGFFDETNYTIRKPVLGFYGCSDIKLSGLWQSGNPGVGIAAADRDAIVTALSLTPTALEYAYFAMRHAFLNFYDCDNVVVEDCALVPDACARERFTFAGCQNVEIVRPKSVSTGNNFASLGKVINCQDVVISGCQVVDTGTGSLWDVIGKNITLRDTHITYPNGYLCDVSHEWGPANAPSDNILIADCSTTGQGVTNVSVSSTSGQITANDITNVVVRNIRVGVGRTDWSGGVVWVRLPTVKTYTIEGGYVENGAIGYTHAEEGGQEIRVFGTKFRWTVAGGTLATNGRTFTAPTALTFYGCDFDADATGSGVASIGIAGGAGIPVRFIGCVINDTVFATTNPAVEFIDCVITSSSISASGGGSYKYTDCVVDGVRMSGGATGASSRFRRTATVIASGDEYGGIEWEGDDASTSSNGKRAELKVFGEGTTGQTYLSYRAAPSVSTSLVEMWRTENAGHFRPGTDNTQTLGSSSFRWSQLHAGTATIATSDAALKVIRGELDDAELRIGRRLGRLLKMFQFADAVQAKGDGARLHAGLIAQEVAEAFAAEGRDAAHYGMWCADELIEEVEVVVDGAPALVSMPVLDTNGAPVIRQGLRYDHVWAFILAAQEQRISALESGSI